jgi:hypothetical protein
MASPRPEWSGPLSPREEQRHPGAINLLRALEAQWLASDAIELYQKPFERALEEAPATLTRITPPLEALVGGLPAEYVKRVRPATPFLFLTWMPIGYASILSLDAKEALPDATTAMMQYGAAITVLDDIADTALYDGVWGEGVSDAIADFVATHGLPAPARLLPALPRKARWAIDYTGARLRSFRSRVAKFRGFPELAETFEAVIRTFLDSVRTCRRVRRQIAKGRAQASDLRAMTDAVPHGMTVVMVALLSHAQRGGGRDPAETRHVLEAADIAQTICHYQNALATLEREIDDGDPTNPIVLEAMESGLLDQRAYMERKLPKTATLAVVEPIRAALEARLISMEREFDERTHDADRGDTGLFHRFGFGVRNLHFLYKIARGQV